MFGVPLSDIYDVVVHTPHSCFVKSCDDRLEHDDTVRTLEAGKGKGKEEGKIIQELTSFSF